MKQYRVMYQDIRDKTWFPLCDDEPPFGERKMAQNYIELLEERYPEEQFYARHKIQEREVSEWRDSD